MELALAICIGLLYAAGIYMILRKSLVKLIIGLILLGNGVNLLIFLLGRITKGVPPIIPEDLNSLGDIYADPVPQALILTAIVVGVATTAVGLALAVRIHENFGTIEDELIDDEEPPEGADPAI